MTPNVPIEDVLDRTLENLEAIYQLRSDGEPVFEVTQLVNSFVLAFVHPRESWDTGLKGMSLEEAEKFEWPMVEKGDARDERPQNYGQVISRIRHGIAHGNMTFLQDGNHELRAIGIWNQKGDFRTWGADIELETLRRFLLRFQEPSKDNPDLRKREPRHLRDTPKL